MSADSLMGWSLRVTFAYSSCKTNCDTHQAVRRQTGDWRAGSLKSEYVFAEGRGLVLALNHL